MARNNRPDGNTTLQLQKLYLVLIALELTIDRVWYRVGFLFIPEEIYAPVDAVGTVARYALVLGNFMALGAVAASHLKAGEGGGHGKLDEVVGAATAVAGVLLAFPFAFAQLGLLFTAWLQVALYAAGAVAIHAGTLKGLKADLTSDDGHAGGRVEKVLLVATVVSLLLAFDVALVYQSSFTLRPVTAVGLEADWFQLAQVLVVFPFACLVLSYWVAKRAWPKFKPKRLVVPLVAVVAVTVVIIGFVNSPMRIISQEETLITPRAIFAWTAIYVLGFSHVVLGPTYLNVVLVLMGAFLCGVYASWLRGKQVSDPRLKQLAYALFVLFCASFTWVETSDLFFFGEVLVGFAFFGVVPGKTTSSPAPDSARDD
ncbi:MAG: hypothetical protein Kow0069_04980 [Promethearchaeota archaeon]